MAKKKAKKKAAAPLIAPSVKWSYDKKLDVLTLGNYGYAGDIFRGLAWKLGIDEDFKLTRSSGDIIVLQRYNDGGLIVKGNVKAKPLSIVEGDGYIDIEGVRWANGIFNAPAPVFPLDERLRVTARTLPLVTLQIFRNVNPGEFRRDKTDEKSKIKVMEMDEFVRKNANSTAVNLIVRGQA